MSLARLLAPARVTVAADLRDKPAVLNHLADLIASADAALDRGELLASFLARERLGSTGLGHGIAIPHGRSAAQREALGACIITRAPLDYDASDNQPVDIFVGLSVSAAAPTEHLTLLAEIATVLAQESVRRELRRAPDAATAYRVLTGAGPGNR
ncbi:MAG: PTS sugar transporter subunit IIA [Gammaproteobacteria bacterium]|nr:PTS sugar transporter subunit IIA [Gammaproteobacteria bacterium]